MSLYETNLKSRVMNFSLFEASNVAEAKTCLYCQVDADEPDYSEAYSTMNWAASTKEEN